MGKRLLRAVGVLFVLSFMTSTVMAASDFSDVKGTDWFKGDLDYVVNDTRQIIAGYPDGTYRPEAILQVDQFIKCLVLAAGHDLVQGDGYWAQNYIDKAIEEGYISESDFTVYDEGISRQAMAMIVARVMDQMEAPIYSKLNDIESELKDRGSIETKHRQAVYKVYELGIITGYPDGNFKPNKTLTRAEAIVVVHRIIEAASRQPFVVTVDPYEAHYVGGTEWVDPVSATDEVSIAEDMKLISSEKMFYDGSRGEWDDMIGIIIKYDEGEYPIDQLEDFKRLISRRLSAESVEAVMDYISVKKGRYIFLEEEKRRYMIEDYHINIVDMIELKGTKYQQSASIEIMLWK